VFSPGNPASYTTKTGRHAIAEILLKNGVKTPTIISNQIKIEDLRSNKTTGKLSQMLYFLCSRMSR